MRSSTMACGILIALALTGGCEAQEKPSTRGSQASALTASEGQTLADAMWQKVLSICQVPGSTTPTMYFHRMEYKSHFYAASLFGSETLFEYRGTWKRFYPLLLTDADRLNGIQFTGLAILGARTVRELDNDTPRLSNWSAWQDRGNEVPSAADTRQNSDLTNWGSVMLKATLMKVNNKWIYYADGGVPRDDISFDPNAISARKLTCAAASSANPFSYSSRSGETGK